MPRFNLVTPARHLINAKWMSAGFDGMDSDLDVFATINANEIT